MLTVGSVNASLAAIVSVIVSPSFARAVSASFDDTIDTSVKVGVVRSIVTSLLSSTAVRVTPPLLAKSSNVMDRLDAPSSTWLVTTVYEAFQLVPLPRTLPVCPAMDIVGETMISSVRSDTVMTSPEFARAESASFEETMLTSKSVGGVKSSVTTLSSVVASAATPTLLAISAYSIRIAVAPSVT